MSQQTALFDPAPYEVAGAAEVPVGEPVSAGRRRTLRHARILAKGGHPISGQRLHPDAAPHDDRTAEGLRCKDCRFRQLTGGHSRGFPKCYWPNPDAYKLVDLPRVSMSAATDCRAWYPACVDFEPRKVTVANGVCPCCHRHFVNVERHMQSKHPDFEGASA